MASVYTDNPSNIADIVPYVILDKNTCGQEILMAEKCFFYDACSFRKHANLPNTDLIFEFFKRKNGIVVITRTIIMELASASHTLNHEYIEYLRRMHQANVKILVVYEEDIFDTLSQCFSSNAQINKFLDIAVKVAKSTSKTMNDVYDSDVNLRTDLLSGNHSEPSLFARFFSSVRGEKKSEDNLGEAMIAICVHLLSNIPDFYDYKYIVMTEDKGAVRLVNKLWNNIRKHIGKSTVAVLTMPALSQKMYQECLITTKSQLLEFLYPVAEDGQINIVVLEEYDLEPQEKKMACSDITDKIMTPNAIRIYY